MRKLIQNALYLPLVDFYLVSSHQHDYNVYTYPDDSFIAVDGGLEYRKVSGDLRLIKYQDFCLYEDSPWSEIIEKKLWGSRRKSGLVFRPLKELSKSHLKAIVDNCPYRSETVDKVIKVLLA